MKPEGNTSFEILGARHSLTTKSQAARDAARALAKGSASGVGRPVYVLESGTTASIRQDAASPYDAITPVLRVSSAGRRSSGTGQAATDQNTTNATQASTSGAHAASTSGGRSSRPSSAPSLQMYLTPQGTATTSTSSTTTRVASNTSLHIANGNATVPGAHGGGGGAGPTSQRLGSAPSSKERPMSPLHRVASMREVPSSMRGWMGNPQGPVRPASATASCVSNGQLPMRRSWSLGSQPRGAASASGGAGSAGAAGSSGVLGAWSALVPAGHTSDDGQGMGFTTKTEELLASMFKHLDLDAARAGVPVVTTGAVGSTAGVNGGAAGVKGGATRGGAAASGAGGAGRGGAYGPLFPNDTQQVGAVSGSGSGSARSPALDAPSTSAGNTPRNTSSTTSGTGSMPGGRPIGSAAAQAAAGGPNLLQPDSSSAVSGASSSRPSGAAGSSTQRPQQVNAQPASVSPNAQPTSTSSSSPTASTTQLTAPTSSPQQQSSGTGQASSPQGLHPLAFSPDQPAGGAQEAWAIRTKLGDKKGGAAAAAAAADAPSSSSPTHSMPTGSSPDVVGVAGWPHAPAGSPPPPSLHQAGAAGAAVPPALSPAAAAAVAAAAAAGAKRAAGTSASTSTTTTTAAGRKSNLTLDMSKIKNPFADSAPARALSKVGPTTTAAAQGVQGVQGGPTTTTALLITPSPSPIKVAVSPKVSSTSPRKMSSSPKAAALESTAAPSAFASMLTQDGGHGGAASPGMRLVTGAGGAIRHAGASHTRSHAVSSSRQSPSRSQELHIPATSEKEMQALLVQVPGAATLPHRSCEVVCDLLCETSQLVDVFGLDASWMNHVISHYHPAIARLSVEW